MSRYVKLYMLSELHMNHVVKTKETYNFNVPLGEWEKIPRLQAKTLVGLRYYEKISQNLP